MIESTFTESHSLEWVKANITDPTNELFILRKIIPWQIIIKPLSQFYDDNKGRLGISLRIVVAVLILSKLRGLSDEKVVKQIKENRYYQYFCNVPDKKLFHFLNPSSLCRIRQRLGTKGMTIIEKKIL